jgi:4-hydroxybenzoate polyprenyltransferase
MNDTDAAPSIPSADRAAWAALLAALRPVQWAKNGLMIVPLLTGHALTDAWRWGQLGLALAAMCLVASATYLVNDLVDRDHDRMHPVKKHRPIAAGTVSTRQVILTAAILGLGGLVLAGLVGAAMLGVVGLYVGLTAGYSMYFKRKLALDVLVLAGLYTLRIIAGGVAVDLFPTDWLLACSMFLFMSLACVKRYSELQRLAGTMPQRANGRAYHTDDLPVLLVLGGATGYLTVMVVALYIDGTVANELYAHPARLWLACPVALYWISRLWLMTHRGVVGEDPLLFALKDRTSWACLAMVVLIAMLAKGG